MQTYYQSNYTESMTWLRIAAEMPDVRAQEALGLMYLFGWKIYGEEVPQDRSQARAWFSRAATLGSELARHMLNGLSEQAENEKPDTNAYLQ
jgi:TPR repeat protein